MSSSDRRSTPRYKPKPETHITYAVTSAFLRDLSLGGVFVLDADPLPIGSEIIFTLRTGGQNISLEGTVRQAVDGEGMGIQFTKVSAKSKIRLRSHIAGLASIPGVAVKT